MPSKLALPESYVVDIGDELRAQIEKGSGLVQTTSSPTDTERNHAEMTALLEGIAAGSRCVVIYEKKIPNLKRGLRRRKDSNRREELAEQIKSIEASLAKYQDLLAGMKKTLAKRNQNIIKKIHALGMTDSAWCYQDFYHLIRSVATRGCPHTFGFEIPEQALIEAVKFLEAVEDRQPWGLQVTLHGFLDLLLTFSEPQQIQHVMNTSRVAPRTSIIEWVVSVTAELWDKDPSLVTGTQISPKSALEKIQTFLAHDSETSLLRRHQVGRGLLYYLSVDLERLTEVEKALMPLFYKLPLEIVFMIKDYMLEDRPKITKEKMTVTYSARKKVQTCENHDWWDHPAFSTFNNLTEEHLSCPKFARHYWCPSTRAWQHDHWRRMSPAEKLLKDTMNAKAPLRRRSEQGWYTRTRCRYTSDDCDGHFVKDSWIRSGQEHVRREAEKVVDWD